VISTPLVQDRQPVAESDEAPASESGPIRVLIVDENPDHAFLTARALRRGDFRGIPLLAGDGASCLAAVQEQPPDAIVMDYRLPDTDGLAVLSKLHDLVPHVPVIFATSEGSEDVAVAAMKLGAVDYVVKDGDYLKHLPEIITLSIQRLRQAAGQAATVVGSRSQLLDEVTGVLTEEAFTFFATILVAETGRRKASFGIILVQVDEPAIGASDELTAAPCSGWWPVH